MNNFEKKANETINLVNKLSVNLKSLIKDQNNLINEMPIDIREKLTMEQIELNKIMNHVKNGDVESLIKLQKRYANANN